MDCSIIICTRNRAESLRLTLESISRTTVPVGWTIELLVIDNGSSDNTVEVINKAHLGSIALRYKRESAIGLSNARNTGTRETLGDVILFTDDDVRVPSNWIEGMCVPIKEGEADAVAGGVGFPKHLESFFFGPLKQRKGWLASTVEINPDHPERMVGANMAFHRRVLASGIKFDDELGAGALGSGEETLFSQQLLSLGYRLIARFEVAVEHHFDTTRLTKDGLLEMARKMGRSHAFLFHHWENQKSRFIIPRLIISHMRRCYSECLEPFRKTATFKVSEQLLQVEEDLGFYREYMKQRRRPKKYRSNAAGLNRMALHAGVGSQDASSLFRHRASTSDNGRML